MAKWCATSNPTVEKPFIELQPENDKTFDRMLWGKHFFGNISRGIHDLIMVLSV